MANWISDDDVKQLGSMPADDVAQLEMTYPGITGATVAAGQSLFEARLRKRYVLPVGDPAPAALRQNLAQWVAYRLWLKRGYNPASEQSAAIRQDYDDALAWLKEAADGLNGLIELPQRETSPTGAGAVAVGGPLASSEASPYAWTDVQVQEANDSA